MSSPASGSLETRAQAHPIARYDRGLSRLRRRHPVRGLADDIDFLARAPFGDPRLDDDWEACTLPDWIDQTTIERWVLPPDWNADAEPDDEDHGIDDLPHGAREEDGI